MIMASSNFSYLLAPFLAWFMAGTLKFIFNSIRARRWAFRLIGYGGLPSTHSAIVSSTVAMVAWRERIGHPAFGVAVTLAFIVMLDAGSLRQQVGRQAKCINRLSAKVEPNEHALLRERMGHSGIEIVSGILVGVGVVSAICALSSA